MADLLGITAQVDELGSLLHVTSSKNFSTVDKFKNLDG